MAALAERDASLHARRMGELGYLANVLIAGCASGGRRLRPVEAAEAATATCNLGLEQLALADPAAALAATEADRLFRIGWHLLHRDAVLPAWRALARRLDERARRDPDPRLAAASQALHKAMAAGRPLAARRARDLLPLLFDDPAPLAALTDELPRLPDRLVATRADLAAAARAVERSVH
jgi:hypothetical protein